MQQPLNLRGCRLLLPCSPLAVCAVRTCLALFTPTRTLKEDRGAVSRAPHKYCCWDVGEGNAEPGTSKNQRTAAGLRTRAGGGTRRRGGPQGSGSGGSSVCVAISMAAARPQGSDGII